MNMNFLRLLRLFLLSCALFALAGCSLDFDGDDDDGDDDATPPPVEKFFGTAAGQPNDYEDLLTYFNQITPENAGKWGSVEATRDVMDWTALDTAYQFSRDHEIPFKLHTLIWGQQQPAWLDALTPEEQLEEIDEWMSELAARYPDVEMIDVVNEPLHAPPSYKDALGGDGATGWDWVITAFQMARAHFPEAELILNDYQILHLPQFTAQYREIIDLLNDRGLIDAIGEQGHFLERTQPSMVKTNLNTLAETGLPIYITEFDLNFADDAQQANVMRKLFRVFWEHPSVMGVTHWGYQQGNVWQANAYLLHTDGTERPALEWLVCYLGGEDDCDVPDYEPSGWTGSANGVTLEAELYDKGEGLVALGSVVAYTNPGDWIKFTGVEFQNDWDKLWVTYTKGNDPEDDDGANITIHIGSLSNAPVMTIALPYTGGWNNFETLEIDWTPLATTENVFIRFNTDEEAVANLDSVRFGKVPPDDDGDLVTDGGFEEAVLDGGWSAWFTGGTSLALSSAKAYAGSKSLLASNRVTNSHPSYNLTTKVEPGVTYSVSAQALHMGAGADTITMTYKLACDGESDVYSTLESAAGVAPDTWTELTGDLTIPADCDITEARIYFEGTTVGVDLYLDEVSVLPPPETENLMSNGSFETGIAGWSSWNGSTLSASSAQAHDGSQSLLATARPDGNQFAVSPNIGASLTAGTTYPVSAWVYQAGAGADLVRLVSKLACDGEADAYNWVESDAAVPANTWTELSGELVIPADCTITEVLFFFEGTTAGVDVYIDDMQVTGESSGDDNLMSNGDFESGTTGWSSWNGSTVGASSAQVHGGSQSLLSTARPDTNQFAVSPNIGAALAAGTSYTVSAWVYQAGAGADLVRMVSKLACDGEADAYNWVESDAAVPANTWTELSGNLVVPADCTITEALFFFEGTTAGVDVYIDDVSVLAP
ncbi:MAG TPA: endo-1,4-beta-xylanase [Gammaproteobacteria bacterium]|nr:endo-1,4-beta-xylanase [Gammaproteobacteria bacterium]